MVHLQLDTAIEQSLAFQEVYHCISLEEISSSSEAKAYILLFCESLMDIFLWTLWIWSDCYWIWKTFETCSLQQ